MVVFYFIYSIESSNGILPCEPCEPRRRRRGEICGRDAIKLNLNRDFNSSAPGSRDGGIKIFCRNFKRVHEPAARAIPSAPPAALKKCFCDVKIQAEPRQGGGTG